MRCGIPTQTTYLSARKTAIAKTVVRRLNPKTLAGSCTGRPEGALPGGERFPPAKANHEPQVPVVGLRRRHEDAQGPSGGLVVFAPAARMPKGHAALRPVRRPTPPY